MKNENMLEVCKKCNDLLTEYAITNISIKKKSIESRIERFLSEHFMELKDYQEYKALFLKYVYVKEGINNNE